MDQKPNKAVLILGWLVVIIQLVACFFKIQHWPGSTPLLILGPVLILFFYLPLWLGSMWKEKNERFFIITQFFYLFLLILAQLFKFQHWPLGGILSNLAYWGCFFILIPVTLIKLFRFGRSSLYKFNNLILWIFLVASMQTNLMRSSETNVGAGSIALSSTKAEASYDKIKSKSKHLYEAFEQLNDKQTNEYYKRSQLLRAFTDSAERYLHDLKTEILSRLDPQREVNFDTMSISLLWNKIDNKITTAMLVGGDPSKLETGKFSGIELKSLIDTYRDSVLKFADDDNRTFIGSGINLNTDESINQDGENQSWIVTNFDRVPAITVLITLTNLEYEIKNAEAQVLTDLLNNASKDSKDNLASKVADLGYKLESEKKKREIEILQKEKDLTQVKMDAKNAEIANRDQAIAWFLIILLVFAALIFFIIRSNILRRKTNKLLQAQKEEIENQKDLIEVKQKEILDSIHYAKRIQNSLLPHESVIEKDIDRLQK